MKIAYLARRPIPSVHAHTVQIVKMCEAFGQLGHEVVLFADRGDAEPASTYARYGVSNSFAIDVYPRRLKHFRKPRFVMRLLRRPFVREADLFFGRDITSLAAVSFLGRPLVYEAHAIPRIGSFRWRLLSWLLARDNFSHLVCVTSTLAELHRRQFPSLAGKPVIVVPNAAADVPPKAADVEWPGRVEAVQIGFVGRPFPGKGIEMMVAAARRLPELDFHVVGASKQDLHWVNESLPSNLFLHGYQAHGKLGAYYDRFDVAVAPYGASVMNASRVESAAITSPLKLLEYMAAGLPSIVSDLPGVRDLLAGCDEPVTVLVKAGNEQDFVDALERLARDAELRKKMGEAARARYLRSHTVKARAKAVLGGLEIQ